MLQAFCSFIDIFYCYSYERRGEVAKLYTPPGYWMQFHTDDDLDDIKGGGHGDENDDVGAGC